MKRKIIMFAAAVFCALCASNAATFVTSDWDPDGYGNWSEATRWKSGSPLRNLNVLQERLVVTK